MVSAVEGFHCTEHIRPTVLSSPLWNNPSSTARYTRGHVLAWQFEVWYMAFINSNLTVTKHNSEALNQLWSSVMSMWVCMYVQFRMSCVNICTHMYRYVHNRYLHNVVCNVFLNTQASKAPTSGSSVSPPLLSNAEQQCRCAGVNNAWINWLTVHHSNKFFFLSSS